MSYVHVTNDPFITTDPRVKEVARVIQAYENTRMGGLPEDMERVYGLTGDHKTYLEKKHRRHIDFRPFNSYLDSVRRLHYASLVLARMEYDKALAETHEQHAEAMGDES
mgnify:CR=1 FL=1|tara:strand:+ start:2927 stop:3253 length:327 start_codon:yes stop_codon:yes gene_type:complete